MFSHFKLKKCWGNLIPVDVFASDVAKMLPGSNSPKFLKPEMRNHWQGSNFPKIPRILASMGSARAIVAQIFGIWGKFDPCQCSFISGFKEFWGNLIPVDVFASDVAKMLPGSNFPKVFEARNAKTLAGIKFPQNSENPSIYGKCGGHSCSDFWNLGEI